MAQADFLLRECLNHCGDKLDQFQSSEDECRGLANLGGNLLDAVLRFVKPHQRGEAVRFVERMHVAALEVLDNAGFECLGIGQFDDADGRGFESGQLRRAIAPRSGDDLEVLAHGPHNERREDALRFDGLGQFAKRRLIEAAARVGCRLSEAHKRQVAILGLRLNCGCHGDSPYVVVESECVGGHSRCPSVEWRVTGSGCAQRLHRSPGTGGFCPKSGRTLRVAVSAPRG